MIVVLTEGERVTALTYYKRGWSLPEIVSELATKRAEKLKWDMRSEVAYLIAHRFSSKEKVQPCNETFAEEIIRKRLARGDVEEDGILKRVHLIQTGRAHVYPKVRVQESC